jgi:hypothetical protein
MNTRAIMASGLVISLLAAGAYAQRDRSATSDVSVIPNLTIKAGVVRIDQLVPPGPGIVQPYQYKGEYDVHSPRGSEIGIPSYGVSGACLVHQIAGKEKQCSTDSECNLYMEGRPVRTTWNGYCLAGENNASPKTCWIKQSENYCLKGQEGTGKHYTPGVDVREVYDEAHRRTGHNPAKVDWRVLACLNGIDPAHPDNRPCRDGPDNPTMVQHSAGPILPLTR